MLCNEVYTDKNNTFLFLIDISLFAVVKLLVVISDNFLFTTITIESHLSVPENK